MEVTFAILLFYASSIAVSGAYNILIMAPFASKSHKNGIDPIAEELGARGHNVTLMSPIKVEKDPPGVKNVFLPLAKQVVDKYYVNYFHVSPGNVLNLLKLTFDLAHVMTNAVYHEPEVLKLIANTSTQSTGDGTSYDVMILDAGFTDYLLPLAHHLRLPVIYTSPAQLFPFVAWNLNIPYPYSYIPATVFNLTTPMSFLTRAANTVCMLTFTLLYRNHFLFSAMDAHIQAKYFPHSPPIRQLENRVAFQLTNSHPALTIVAPSMPYYREVGCLHCQSAKPLPPDLETIFEESGQLGVIYFSLGSVTKGQVMPAEMKNRIVNAFAQLEQQVIWKYEIGIKDLPKNVKLIKWAPQQDLLGHPKLRLFISHGGALSTMESAYHGCPLLGFPLAGDQVGNIANAKRHGFAEDLNWETFTEDEFLFKIKMMLNDQRFKRKAVDMSVKLKDNLQAPREEAAYWVEYVIRHQGAPHLKSGAERLNFFQYFLLDVIACMALVMIIIFVCLYLLLKFSYRFIRNMWPKRDKQKKF